MRKHATILGVIAIILVGDIAIISLIYFTERPSPTNTVVAIVGGAEIEIVYCQPQRKGRVIFGGLVPYGEVWRTGANEATTFSVDREITFGGQRLAAGTYGLFTVPAKESWTVILNENADQWGAFDYDAGMDVLRVEAPVEELGIGLEYFTIALDDASEGADLLFRWDTTSVVVPLGSA
jgi:hypothetical protein